MRRAGAGYPEIGAALGISKGNAYMLVKRALDEARETMGEDLAFLRDVQNARIEKLLARIEADLEPTPRKIPGLPALPPKTTAIEASHAVVKLLDRQAKLNGLDAAVKVAVGQPGRKRADGTVEPGDGPEFLPIAILPAPHETPESWASTFAPTTPPTSE
jgi:hypothetical protein